MLIRLATLADTTIIRALASQSSTAAQWPREHYEQAIQNAQPRRILLVLEKEKSILAFLIARTVDQEWELENIAVANEARRQKLGSHLLEDFLNVAHEEKAESIFLEVRESNSAARAFYEKHGFKQNGRRPKYYNHPQEDAVIYRLSFSGTAT